MKKQAAVTGYIVNIPGKKFFYGTLVLEDGKIKSVEEHAALTEPSDLSSIPFIIPGFIDAHVHIESSMLVPSEFARLAVVHGTVGTVSDPHEIANVCGMAGIEYMIENGNTVPFKFNFGAPSCVPATIFETAGASISVEDVKALIARPDIKYLSEMMNFPGVLSADAEVMDKIKAAHVASKPVDGHAPGLRGKQAQSYIDALTHIDASGSQLSATDHECFTFDEALDKLQRGMKIIIREGSAAKNFEALIPLLHHWPDQIMFCSDDKHPDSLLEGHINQLCERAVAKGINVYNVLQAACINPVTHYNLDIGLLNPGDAADFAVVNNLTNFKVLQTFIDGQLVASNGVSLITTATAAVINQFDCSPVSAADLHVADLGQEHIAVIEALDGQLITNKLLIRPLRLNEGLHSDVDNDILKIVVYNRYKKAPVSKAFIKNFGLKTGALASSVAHDSHNIVAVGADDESLEKAINLIVQNEGGICAVSRQEAQLIALPVAGLMTNVDGYAVAAAYTRLDNFAKNVLGSTLQSPFMTLSFMALLVIPKLKISDKGLFDGETFSFV